MACPSRVRTLWLATHPRGPEDLLRRVLNQGLHGAGLLLARAPGQQAVLLRFGPGSDAATLMVAGRLPVQLLDVLVVSYGRWRSLMCQDTNCCALQSHALPDCSGITARDP